MKTSKIFLLLILNLQLNNLFSQNELPQLNQKTLDFCKKSMGKKVDRGECWDLAKHALDYAGAKWEVPYNFGKIINAESDTILAGDIIQFEKVKLSDGTVFPHHTAIVYKVLSSRNYTIVHQNFNNIKKLSTLDLDLSLLKKGSVLFFRPI